MKSAAEDDIRKNRAGEGAVNQLIGASEDPNTAPRESFETPSAVLESSAAGKFLSHLIRLRRCCVVVRVETCVK
jgi:hypothetical protein